MTNFFAPVERGVQHAALRAANRRAVLTTIAFNPGMSNADVSRHTGLAPQTASAIVSELETEGLILRGDVLRGRRGQPATPLYLNHNAIFSVGCEVSWRHVEIILQSLGAREIGHYRRDFDLPDPDSIVAECASAIADLVDQLSPEERERFIGIGLSTPAAGLDGVDLPMLPPDTPLPWQTMDLRKELAEATGFETHSFDQGSAGAWAELMVLQATATNSFAYLFLGCSISAGIVTDNALWEVPGHSTSNLGLAMVSDAAGQRRYGHDVASLCALASKAMAAGLPQPTGNPMGWDWEAMEPYVAEWLVESGQALADIGGNVTAAIGITTIVIDSELPPEILARLVESVREALQARPPGPLPVPEIKAGRWGQKATAFGAAILNFYTHFFVQDANGLR